RERQALQRRTAATACPVSESQIANAKPAPAASLWCRNSRGGGLRNTIANDIGAGVIGMLAGKGLEMRGNRGDHTRCLLGVLPNHVQAAQQQHGSGAA